MSAFTPKVTFVANYPFKRTTLSHRQPNNQSPPKGGLPSLTVLYYYLFKFDKDFPLRGFYLTSTRIEV